MQNKKLVLLSTIAVIVLFLVVGYIYKNKKSQKFIKMLEEQSSLIQLYSSFVLILTFKLLPNLIFFIYT